MFKFVLLLMLTVSSLLHGADDESILIEIECSICTLPVAKKKAIHDACFLQYVEGRLKNGHWQIPKLDNFRLFSSENQTKFYDHDEIVDFLTNQGKYDLIELLTRNMVRAMSIDESGAIPCSHENCDGMFENKQMDDNYLPLGKLCPTCNRPFELPEIDKETLNKARLCPRCKALNIRDEGCTTMNCGNCRHLFEWSEAAKANRAFRGKKKDGPCCIQ